MRTELTDELNALESKIDALDTNKLLRVTNVTTVEVQPSRFEHFFTVQGSVETDQNALLYPEAAGRVTAIWIQEGKKVTKGQKLLTLDNSIITQQMQELQSRLTLVETVFKKQEKLWEQKVGSEIQYLEAKNNYESLKQNLETLMAQNDMYVITAPFNGVIDEVNIKEGEMAAPQIPALRLVNLDKVYIKSDVTERYLGKIKAGDSVKVLFPSIDEMHGTTISRMGEFINPDNRTFKVRLELENKKGTLKPNLLGELNIRDYVNDNALVIPTSLIQMTPSGESFVYLLENGAAKKTEVTTGMSYDDEVVVLTGLSAGAVMIDKGARSIKDGDSVNVIR
ncbi:MAG: efflux RND transporter periplasmic adaptor subunit [Flavobacteriales bacterium]|nr:efflux RND transporter periplasmic adaptor subunit [Flavobacteriales bacterium]